LEKIEMNFPKIIAAIPLTVLLYGVSFILRTEFSILSYSALIDWMIVFIFAAIPCLFIGGQGVLKLSFLYTVTVVLEVAATVVIIITLYPAIL
jgi:hypothetical protein